MKPTGRWTISWLPEHFADVGGLACLLPVRFLSDAELARLSGWPDEIADDDLITFFTMIDDDIGWLTANFRRENHLGVAVQLCTLPWFGWIPDQLDAYPTS